MARYGRRRTSRRRTGRRGTRTLSTRSIFNNKGARAQASQISSLKKRVNYVYRQCRPEVKILQSAGAVQLLVDRSDIQPYYFTAVPMPQNGTADNQLIGNVCNVKDIRIDLTTQVDMGAQSIQYTVAYHLPVTINYRVIAFMSKVSMDEQIDPNSVLRMTNYLTSPTDYYMNTTKPFNEGASAMVDIIYDRRFSISNQERNMRNHTLRVKGSRIQKYLRNDYLLYGQSQLYLLIVPVMHYEQIIDTESQNPPFNPRFMGSLLTKIAYTDP